MAQVLTSEELKRKLRGRAGPRPTDYQPPPITRLSDAEREEQGGNDPNYRREITKSYVPSAPGTQQRSRILTAEQLKEKLAPQPQGRGMVHAFGTGQRHGFTGEAMHAMGLQPSDRFEEPYEPVGFGEELAHGLGRLASDLPLYAGSGGAAAATRFLPAAGRAGVPLVRTLGQKVMQSSARGAFTFGAPAVVSEAMHQAQDEGELDPTRIAAAGASAATTGALVGPAGLAPSRAGGFAAEIGAFEVGSAAAEQRLPDWEGLIFSASFIGILKLTHGLPQMARPEVASLGRKFQQATKSVAEGWRLNGNLEAARKRVDPKMLDAVVMAWDQALAGDTALKPMLDALGDRPSRARIENARKAVDRAYETGDEYQLRAAEQQLRAAEEDVARQADALIAEYRRTIATAQERTKIAGPGGVVEGRQTSPSRDQPLPSDPTGFRGTVPGADRLRNEYADLATELQRAAPGDLTESRVAEIDKRMRAVSETLAEQGESLLDARSVSPESGTRVSRGRAFEGAEQRQVDRPRMTDDPELITEYLRRTTAEELGGERRAPRVSEPEILDASGKPYPARRGARADAGPEAEARTGAAVKALGVEAERVTAKARGRRKKGREEWDASVEVPAMTWAAQTLRGDKTAGRRLWTRRHGRAYGAKLGLSNKEMRAMTSKQLADALFQLSPRGPEWHRRLVKGGGRPPTSRTAREPDQRPPKKPPPDDDGGDGAPTTEAARVEQFRAARRALRKGRKRKPAKAGRPGAQQRKRGAVKSTTTTAKSQVSPATAGKPEPKTRTGDPPFKYLRDEALKLARSLKDTDAARAIETQYAERVARWRAGEEVESGLQDVVSGLMDKVEARSKAAVAAKAAAKQKKAEQAEANRRADELRAAEEKSKAKDKREAAAAKRRAAADKKKIVSKQADAAEAALEKLAGRTTPKPKGKTVDEFSTPEQFAAYYKRNKIRYGGRTGDTYESLPKGYATRKNQSGRTITEYADELVEAGRFADKTEAVEFIEEVIRNPTGTKVPTRGAGADLDAEIAADAARHEMKRREREGEKPPDDFGDMGAALRKGRAVKMQKGPGGKSVPAEDLVGAKVEAPGIYGTVVKVSPARGAQIEVEVAGEKTTKYWVPFQAVKVVSLSEKQVALFADPARETEQLGELRKAEAESRKRELDLPLLGTLTEKTMKAEAAAVEQRRLDEKQISMFDKLDEEGSLFARGRGSADEQHPDTPKPPKKKPPRSLGAGGPGEMGRLTRQARAARAALSRQLMADAKRMGMRAPKLKRVEPKPLERPRAAPKKPRRQDAEIKFAEDALVIPKEGLELSDGERSILVLENANVKHEAAKMLGQEGVPKAQIDVLTPAEKVIHITRRVRAARHWKHLDNVLTAAKYDVRGMPRADIEAVLLVAGQRMVGMPKVPKSLRDTVATTKVAEETSTDLGPMIQQQKKWFFALAPARHVLRDQPRILEDATEGLRGATEVIKSESNALVRMSKNIIFVDLDGKRIRRYGRDDAIIFELVNNSGGDPAWIDRPSVTFQTTGRRGFSKFKKGEQAAVKEFHRVSARLLREIYEDFRIRQNLRPEQIRRHYMTHTQSRQIDFRPATLKQRSKIHQLAKKHLGKDYDAVLVAEQLPKKILRNKALQIIDYLEGVRPPKTFKSFKRSVQGMLGADELVSIPRQLRQPYLDPRKGGEYVESAISSIESYSRYALRKIHLEPTILGLRSLIESMPGKGESYKIRLTQREYTEQVIANVLGRPSRADVAIDAHIEHMSMMIGQLKANFPVLRFMLAPLNPAGRFLQRPRAGTRMTTALNRYQYYLKLGLAADSVLTNLTQIVNTAAYYGVPKTMRGYFTLANPFRWGELKRAHLLQEFEHFFTGPQSVWKPTVGRLEKAVLSAFKAAEFVNRGAAYFAGLADAKARGLSFEHGVKLGMGKTSEFIKKNMPEHFQDTFYTSEAEWAARKGVIETQFGYSPTESSPVFSRPGGRVMFQFWNYPTQQSAFLWDGVAGRLATRGTKGARAASSLRFFALLGFAGWVAGPVFRNLLNTDVDNIWSVRGILPRGPGPNVMLAWYLWNTVLDSDWSAKARARQELGAYGEGLILPRASRKAGYVIPVLNIGKLPDEMRTHKSLGEDSIYRVLPVRPLDEPSSGRRGRRRKRRQRRSR